MSSASHWQARVHTTTRCPPGYLDETPAIPNPERNQSNVNTGYLDEIAPHGGCVEWGPGREGIKRLAWHQPVQLSAEEVVHEVMPTILISRCECT
jgi:hypothetical protein